MRSLVFINNTITQYYNKNTFWSPFFITHEMWCTMSLCSATEHFSVPLNMKHKSHILKYKRLDVLVCLLNVNQIHGYRTSINVSGKKPTMFVYNIAACYCNTLKSFFCFFSFYSSGEKKKKERKERKIKLLISVIYKQIMYISKMFNVQCNSKISQLYRETHIRLLCVYYMRRQLMSRNILKLLSSLVFDDKLLGEEWSEVSIYIFIYTHSI